MHLCIFAPALYLHIHLHNHLCLTYSAPTQHLVHIYIYTSATCTLHHCNCTSAPASAPPVHHLCICICTCAPLLHNAQSPLLRNLTQHLSILSIFAACAPAPLHLCNHNSAPAKHLHNHLCLTSPPTHYSSPLQLAMPAPVHLQLSIPLHLVHTCKCTSAPLYLMHLCTYASLHLHLCFCNSGLNICISGLNIISKCSSAP
mgnify:CR=1 FL=1